MDNADKASELEEISRAAALAAAQQREKPGIGSTYCIDCGDEIPAARRHAYPRAERCLECQAHYEKTRHLAAKAARRRA